MIDEQTIQDALTLLLGMSFVLTGIRAVAHKRFILAFACACLVFIPLNRYGIVPRNIAIVVVNIGAFALMYKVNWFLHHYVEDPSQVNNGALDKPVEKV